MHHVTPNKVVLRKSWCLRSAKLCERQGRFREADQGHGTTRGICPILAFSGQVVPKIGAFPTIFNMPLEIAEAEQADWPIECC
jgi:hypothetical protein